MKIVCSVILLICGVIALAGVFLPWASGFGMSISGWDGISESGIDEATEPFLVFIGSIVLLVFALPAVIVSVNPEGSQKVLLTLCILASIGAAVAIGGASWFISDIIKYDSVEFLSYGFYLSYAAAVLGLVFGVVIAIGSQRT